MSLKTLLLKIIDAVASVAGPGASAILNMAKWIIGRYIPDDTEAPAVPSGPEIVPVTAASGDAPDAVKAAVGQLFDAAIGLVGNVFFRKALEAAKYLVLNYALGAAWDAITNKEGVVVTFSAVAIDDAAVEAACGA